MARWVTGANGFYYNTDVWTQMQIQQDSNSKFNLTIFGQVVIGPFDTYEDAVSASNTLLSVTQ